MNVFLSSFRLLCVCVWTHGLCGVYIPFFPPGHPSWNFLRVLNLDFSREFIFLYILKLEIYTWKKNFFSLIQNSEEKKLGMYDWWTKGDGTVGTNTTNEKQGDIRQAIGHRRKRSAHLESAVTCSVHSRRLDSLCVGGTLGGGITCRAVRSFTSQFGF